MRVLDHSRAFFSALALARAGRSGVEDRVRLTPEWFADHLDTGLELSGALDGLEAIFALAAAAPRGDDGRPAAGRRGRRVDRRGGPATWPASCASCIAAADAGYVYFLEVKGRTRAACGRRRSTSRGSCAIS